jgi:small subunit ribosomal protein S27Ae
MQLFVNYLSQTRCLTATADMDSLLASVQSEFALTGDFSLFTGSASVTSLSELSDSQTLFVCVDVLGGGKKKGGKKKKAYTTPKKNKHKHKNQKLHVLEYYALKDGKAEKIKKTCENETCKDKGVFMANHWNRYYCGKCHLTLQKLNAPKEEPKKVKAVAKVDAKDEKEDKAAVAAKKGGKKGK